MANQIVAISKKELAEMLKAAIASGRKLGRDEAKEDSPCYKTEKRLYSLPDLIERVRLVNEEIDEIKTHGLRRRSRDIMLLNSGSVRVTEDDKIAALVRKKNDDIDSDEREIRAIKAAMAVISGDEYYLAVDGHYIRDITDEEIAKEMGIKLTTSIYRNRRRLVNRLSVIFYGAEATK